jgi:two-component system response regulator PilR (NtrC family)
MTRPKILLVDSRDHICDAMQKSLENENLDVVSSATIADALGLIVTHHFDVVITDLQVRRAGDSLTLVTAIRHLQPKALIVAVSDSLNVREAALAVCLGVDFVMKPINIKEVAELIIYPSERRTESPASSGTEEWVATNSRRLA